MNITERELPTARIISAGEGTTFAVGGVTITMKVTGEETGGACTIFEALIPPHFTGFDPCAHEQATATYYVTSGMLAFTIGQETVMVRSGGFVMAPPGELHKFWNPTATPAVCLTYLCPAGFEAYLLALATLNRRNGAHTQADLHKLAAADTAYALRFEA